MHAHNQMLQAHDLKQFLHTINLTLLHLSNKKSLAVLQFFSAESVLECVGLQAKNLMGDILAAAADFILACLLITYLYLL